MYVFVYIYGVCTRSYSVVRATAAPDDVLLAVRRAIDPFLAYRLANAARRITPDDVKRSQKEGRLDLSAKTRQLTFENMTFCPVDLVRMTRRG